MKLLDLARLVQKRDLRPSFVIHISYNDPISPTGCWILIEQNSTFGVNVEIQRGAKAERPGGDMGGNPQRCRPLGRPMGFRLLRLF